MITITAYSWVPPFAQGLVRDLRVRWALEEAGLPYEVRLYQLGENKAPEHRALQPFGQVPAYEEDGLRLFESGAIVLHIARRAPVLSPGGEAARGRLESWAFAAINSVEPPIWTWIVLGFIGEAGQPARAPTEEFIKTRLADLSAALGDREFLLPEGFSAADILMSTVLRQLRSSDLEPPPLAAYRARCEARPAFERALAAQLAPFAEHAPA
jgi:glutathione S-transferase